MHLALSSSSWLDGPVYVKILDPASTIHYLRDDKQVTLEADVSLQDEIWEAILAEGKCPLTSEEEKSQLKVFRKTLAESNEYPLKDEGGKLDEAVTK